MLSDGNRARKSSAFRVIRPLLACARAPIMTSATGRRATLPDRLRWTCLFHAETAIERSSSLTPGGKSIPISTKFFHPLCCGARLPKSRCISKHCLCAFTLRLLHNRYYAGVRILSFVPEQVRPRSHLHILADLGGYRNLPTFGHSCHQCFHAVYNTSCRSSCQGGKLVKKRRL